MAGCAGPSTEQEPIQADRSAITSGTLNKGMYETLEYYDDGTATIDLRVRDYTLKFGLNCLGDDLIISGVTAGGLATAVRSMHPACTDNGFIDKGELDNTNNIIP